MWSKLKRIFRFLFFAILVFIVLVLSAGWYLSAPAYKGPVSDHFDGEVFFSPLGPNHHTTPTVFKYLVTRAPEKWTRNYETFVRSEPLDPVNEGEINVSFVNHSTFLIQTGNSNILTDPHWSKRCSPSQLVGPARMRPPGIKFDALPPIDLVILSHNHYDHLDDNTVKDLEKKFQPLFVVPLGVKAYFENLGVKNVIELDWWKSSQHKDYKVTAVPGNHFTSRGMFDRNKTLWNGYVIEFSDFKLYFGGDTGYSDVFKKIGEHFVEIDLALIPIGAFMPRWFMSPVHLGPDESVEVHKDLRAKQSIGMHFGTFALADDGPETPITVLKEALKEKGVSPEKFIVPEEGHTYRYGRSSLAE